MEIPADRLSPELKSSTAESLPTLFYFNNFPPSNRNGGTVLIRRLVSGYPTEKLVALTNALNSVGPIHPPWCRIHKEFPSLQDSNSKAIWRFKGLINRVKGLTNWLLLPAIAFYGARMMRKHSASAILSITSGTYFLAAAAVARWTKVPLILIVHDDWIPIVAAAVPGPEWLFRPMFRFAIRSADHVFAISAGMQEKLKAEFGVDSEVQLPATDPLELPPAHSSAGRNGALRILYAGNGWAAHDSLMLLIRMVREKTFQRYGVETVELSLLTPWKTDPDPDIKQRGWLSEADARQEIADADVLFLPYAFAAADQVFTRTSFPAKAADYMASGKAILILGPKDSTTARYAAEFHCAELVTELSEDALGQAIGRLASGEEYRRNIVSHAQRAFALNFDIRRHRERFFEVVTGLVNRKRR